MEHANLINRECCSTVGNNILYATLVHRDNIRIAFHHIDKVMFGYSLLGLEDPIQLSFLVIDNTIGRIDVLLTDTFRTRIQQTTTEGDYLSTYTDPREHHSTIESVNQFAILTFKAESNLHQKVPLIAAF